MSASLLSFLFALYAAIAPGGTRIRVEPELMSQQEMEVRVRIDAARTLRVDFEDVRLLQVTAQTWPDARLGCTSKNSEGEIKPDPTPGFRILIRAKANRVTYHTDRTGRVVRCTAPPKNPAPALTASARREH